MNSDPIKLMFELEAKYSEYGAVKLTVCDAWKYAYRFPKSNSPINVRKQTLQDLPLGKVSSFTASLGKFLSIFIYNLAFRRTCKVCNDTIV
jgi:hypothetical protein